MKQFDVAIVGGGLVGLSLAHALAAQASNHGRIIRIALIEKNAQASLSSERTTALSYGGRLIYESLGLWKRIQKAGQPIRSIEVSDRCIASRIVFKAQDMGVPALGYVVSNASMIEALIAALKKWDHVFFFQPCTVEKVVMESSQNRLFLQYKDEKVECTADLMVLADGGGERSLVRDAGFVSTVTDYGQTGIVVNVQHRYPHNGVAYEHFTAKGPMALLPSLQSYHSTLIWTMSPKEADIRMHMEDADFMRALQLVFRPGVGAIHGLGKRLSFDLKMRRMLNPVRTGAVVMGNAAHTLHPVAGQGFNLSLRDAMTLASLLVSSEVPSLGSLHVLQEYFNKQAKDQGHTIWLSDFLVRFFSSTDPRVHFGKRLGFKVLQQPFLKRWVCRKAMGLEGYGQ